MHHQLKVKNKVEEANGKEDEDPRYEVCCIRDRRCHIIQKSAMTVWSGNLHLRLYPHKPIWAPHTQIQIKLLSPPAAAHQQPVQQRHKKEWKGFFSRWRTVCNVAQAEIYLDIKIELIKKKRNLKYD